jgi:uncharacterized membrane protein YkvA (DUF1232 family)
MPFLSPSAARVPPLSFLLADQVEPPRHIARHLGLSLRTLQRYAASGNAPRAAYLALWFESRGDARELWFALRHPAAPGWLKLGSVLIALYVLSPIDLIPDVVPVFGVVDDLLILPLAIRALLKRLPPNIAEAAARRRAG